MYSNAANASDGIFRKSVFHFYSLPVFLSNGIHCPLSSNVLEVLRLTEELQTLQIYFKGGSLTVLTVMNMGSQLNSV